MLLAAESPREPGAASAAGRHELDVKQGPGSVLCSVEAAGESSVDVTLHESLLNST